MNSARLLGKILLLVSVFVLQSQSSHAQRSRIGFWRNSQDPCLAPSPAIGTVCKSKTIWLGVMPAAVGGSDGKKYMVMPGGCSGSTTNPTCSGIDNLSINTTWNDGTSNWYDIPGLENITSATTKSTALGDVNTSVLATSTVPTSGGAYRAAKYCSDMTFGGYTDWYLPSKSELAYMYCKALVSSHDVNYPQEDPNCVNYGGKESLLLGMNNGNWYWSSTESSASASWGLMFSYGGQSNSVNLKYGSALVRCVRRF